MDKTAFYKISYGMYVVSSSLDGKLNGQIANTVFQITSDPPMMAVSINKQNLTHEYIHESGVIAVSALSQDTPMEFIGKFGFKSGRDIDKFQGTQYKSMDGAPVVLDNALAYMILKVENEVDVLTHTVFIGRVIDAGVLSDGQQMTYEYYQKVKKGYSPKNAPTYVENKTHEDIKESGKYKCTICGYIYDPEKGDTDGGIAPGTPFENIPDTWVCPVCGAAKNKFEKL